MFPIALLIFPMFSIHSRYVFPTIPSFDEISVNVEVYAAKHPVESFNEHPTFPPSQMMPGIFAVNDFKLLNS